MSADFIRRFRAGDPLIGTLAMYIRTPGIIRLVASAGFDYVLIDLQHSNLGLKTVADMCELARVAGISTLFRPNTVSRETTNRLLDLGADGLVFHNVDSRRQLDESIALIRNRAEPPFLIAQIESQVGLDNLHSIVSGGGVDAIDVGLQDLAISLGVPGQTRHPRVEAALDSVLAACREHAVAVHVAIHSVEDAHRRVAQGIRLLTWRTDKAILLDSYQRFASDFATT